MMENKKGNAEIQIELSEEIAQGTYANLAIIAHSSSEFILDFIRLVPGVPKAKVQSRIILTPENAKRLQQAASPGPRHTKSATDQSKSSVTITSDLWSSILIGCSPDLHRVHGRIPLQSAQCRSRLRTGQTPHSAGAVSS